MLVFKRDDFKFEILKKNSYSSIWPARTNCGAVPVSVPVPPMLAE